MTLRVFFAHSKSATDETIDRWRHEIDCLFRAEGYDSVEVVPGREDFHQYAVGAGSFTAWAHEVPRRRDMRTGGLVYAAFVCLDLYVGRATADILGGALSAGTPVIFLSEDDSGISAKPVQQVVVVDPDDYIKGWCLDT